jgi:hypothetical protein
MALLLTLKLSSDICCRVLMHLVVLIGVSY